MKLSFDEIKNIVFGAEQISQEEGYFWFHRFTESEKQAYSDSADLIEEKTFIPDVVTVAYGTNDWSKCSKEEFVKNMPSFIRNITENYKDSKIFIITPIWRKDNKKSVQFGTFDEMVTLISNECIKYENLNIIKGQDILPHSDLLYEKDGLHPNDMGMLLYSSNLYREMLKVL